MDRSRSLGADALCDAVRSAPWVEPWAMANAQEGAVFWHLIQGVCRPVPTLAARPDGPHVRPPQTMPRRNHTDSGLPVGSALSLQTPPHRCSDSSRAKAAHPETAS